MRAAPAAPSDEQIASACRSYRHDFGLMDKKDRALLMFQAKEWLHAWRKEFEVAPDAPKGEPTAEASDSESNAYLRDHPPEARRPSEDAKEPHPPWCSGGCCNKEVNG